MVCPSCSRVTGCRPLIYPVTGSSPIASALSTQSCAGCDLLIIVLQCSHAVKQAWDSQWSHVCPSKVWEKLHMCVLSCRAAWAPAQRAASLIDSSRYQQNSNQICESHLNSDSDRRLWWRTPDRPHEENPSWWVNSDQMLKSSAEQQEREAVRLVSYSLYTVMSEGCLDTTHNIVTTFTIAGHIKCCCTDKLYVKESTDTISNILFN